MPVRPEEVGPTEHNPVPPAEVVPVPPAFVVLGTAVPGTEEPPMKTVMLAPAEDKGPLEPKPALPEDVQCPVGQQVMPIDTPLHQQANNTTNPPGISKCPVATLDTRIGPTSFLPHFVLTPIPANKKQHVKQTHMQ